jgi:hypothetical protein
LNTETAKQPFALFTKLSRLSLNGDLSLSLLLGLFSILIIPVVVLLTDLGADWWYIAWLAAFFVNFPHFMISYLLFYRPLREPRLWNTRNLITAIAVPLILLFFIWFAIHRAESDPLVLLLHSMFLLVGWHYVKQGFGIFLFLSEREEIKILPKNRHLILTSMLLLWVGTYFGSFDNDTAEGRYYDLSYYTVHLPTELLDFGSLIVFVGLGLCLTALVVIFVRNHRLSITGTIALLVQFVWMMPMLWVPGYFFVIPFFHSLQYLVMSNWAVRGQHHPTKNNPESATAEWIKWWGAAFILGALCFWFIPTTLDRFVPVSPDTQNFWLIAFIVFINVHHFFIDAALWRRGSHTGLSAAQTSFYLTK